MSLARALMRVVNYVGERPALCVSAPGRADFLNTHQDYKGLPVVPIAISLRTYVFVYRLREPRVVVESLNLRDAGEEWRDEFDLDDLGLVGGGWFGDYVRACFIALKRRGVRIRRGLRLIIWSEVPMGAGLGSSGALVVATVAALSRIAGVELSRQDIAEVAYEAEHDVLGVPCGRLDQYASSFGGTILLRPRPPVEVRKLDFRCELLIVDSGEKHSTAKIHPVRQEEIDRGLAELLTVVPQELRSRLARRHDEVDWERLTLEELEPYLRQISERYARRIEFTLRMNDLTRVAVKLMSGESLTGKDLDVLRREGISGVTGLSLLWAIINRQHDLLRDLYEVSTPRIERIRDAALSAGASAAKLSGAGLGGCILVISGEDAKRVAKACLDAGAPRVWFCRVDDGVRVENLTA